MHTRLATYTASAFALASSLLLISCGDVDVRAPTEPDGTQSLVSAASVSELVVRVLDVGQGDATVIMNGSSTVIIDGGSNGTRFGQLLDSLDLRGKTIDAVIVSHGDTDHASGLRAVFDRSRNIRVNYFFDNTDPTTSSGHQTVRDSVNARVARGETIYRDTDDPCGNGAPLCTLTLAGGARVHVMRPDPNGAHSDNRSNPVKVVGPDSASFSMWLAGDARYDAADWFMDVARYDLYPGMRVNVLKGQEHGNCRSLQPRYLSAVDPEWVTFSLAAENGKGLVNIQTMELLTNQGKPWYRTDQNGGITFRSPGTPGGGYTASVHRGGKNMSGPHDELSTSRQCRWELPPAAPSGLSATAASSSRIDLRWTDNATDEAGFRIERRSAGGSFAQIASVGANVTSFSDTGLPASTTFEYRIAAYSDAGTSAYSNTASATTGGSTIQPPAAPSELSATAASASEIGLKWKDNASNESGFRIERRTSGGSFAQIASVGPNITSYSDSGLASGTTYDYRVLAFNDGGSSSYSNTASATTQSPAPQPPAAPSGLGAAAITTSRIDLQWTDNSANESGFRVERRSGGGSFSQVASLAANVTSYQDTGLASATTYEYRVLAYNADGSSAYSNTASATTHAPPPPISLVVDAFREKGLQKAALSWSGATTSLVSIFRDGTLITTAPNSGSYRDDIDGRGSGSYVYRICEPGTSVCSNLSTASF
jgi:beta-lactamase superfamily II metal-dependent hydrolase